jgi:glycine cleavage system H protein
MDLKQLRFATTHEWVFEEGGVATVGLSRFAVDQLTDLITIELPSVGAAVTAGKCFGEVESVKSVNDLYAPVTGEVVAVNPAVTADLTTMSEDPYEKGWLIKVKVDPIGPTLPLLDAAAYDERVAAEGH